ncbi:MAG TPA: helix-turn-helix domain-containing protein, partial [Polyangiales bacterium]|nr:helix-turn-helix domain-containing protein [Polyangiales bacterium]
PKFVEALCVYDWPLNVRELALLVRRVLGLHGNEPRLKKTHLPERMLDAASSAVEPASDKAAAARDSNKRAWKKTDDDSEFDALVAALRAHGGSVAKAAAAIGLNRARAYRLLSAHPDFSLDELRRGS